MRLESSSQEQLLGGNYMYIPTDFSSRSLVGHTHTHTMVGVKGGRRDGHIEEGRRKRERGGCMEKVRQKKSVLNSVELPE